MATRHQVHVERMLAELWEFYQLGRKVVAAKKERPDDPKVVESVAEQESYSDDMTWKAWRFAKQYKMADFQELVRQSKKHQAPIGKSHIILLVMIEDDRERKALQKQAIETGWSFRQLEEAIMRPRQRPTVRIRRLSRPISRNEALDRTVKMCRKWLWGYGVLEQPAIEGELARAAIQDLPPRVRTLLKQARSTLEEAQALARRHRERLAEDN